MNNQTNNNLKLIPYGGVENVTKNLFIYDNNKDIVVVDCGIGFPDEPGSDEDLIIPDFSYLVKNQHRIRGVFVTHAHFDHYGAVPYLLKKISVPVYTSRLTLEFIQSDLDEHKIKAKNIDFRVINGKEKDINLGSFKITPFHINHSVPESLGLCLKTKFGNIFHISDFKFDFTPLDEDPFDMQKVSLLAADRKPILMLSDCLGAANKGHTESEAAIQEVLENIMIRSKELVLITTLSSNISRIKQAIKASANVGRKVAFLGRSLEQSGNIARKLGYFSSLKNHIISTKKIKKQPFSKLTLITAGSYAQEGSALDKISRGKHNLVKIRPNDIVIFSADPSPPNVILGVNKMIDNLSKLGANVYYYEIQDNLHVSGHGTAEDIKMLIALVKPEYLMPIGGDFRHMTAFLKIARNMRYEKNKILFLKEKQAVNINHGKVILK
jgi:ribonuclease J